MSRFHNMRGPIPSMSGMEDSIEHLPVTKIEAEKFRGWWEVRVYVPVPGEPGMRSGYKGKKDRSYFAALAKSLDAALKGEEIKARD